jgi:hypothetical protein
MNRLFSQHSSALLLLAALLLAGCTHHFDIETPAGFVELAHQARYDYRATSADGLVIGVRELHNDPQGELAFWARAVENQLRNAGGYALLDTRDVKSKDGIAGKQFRFGHDEGKTPHLYSVTVFVTPKRIQVLEIGGTKELMAANATQIDSAVTNFVAN